MDQQAYNGSQSTITQGESGANMGGFDWQTLASEFNIQSTGRVVHAVASITSMDVYYHENSRGRRFGGLGNPYITESTIEHEALHNLTKLPDRGQGNLLDKLGLPPESESTSVIDQALKKKNCTH
jgi:hypothetical protein